jgi:hypothetical protein
MEFRRPKYNTINIVGHHTTVKKWWKKMQQNALTCSATKYLNFRKSFGVYVITPDTPDCHDALDLIWRLK